MQGCQATGKSSKSQAGRARTVLRGTSCPQRRPVDQPPHPEGSHTTVVPFYPAPLLTSLVFLSIPPWPDTPASWLTSVVASLARAAYAGYEHPSGHLDPARLTVLADALEEAGCTDRALLEHLRGPGPHLRGCHVLDLVRSVD